MINRGGFMAYLLLDNNGTNHIRQMSNEPFDYDFNKFSGWKEVEIINKTVAELKTIYSFPEVEPINPENKNDGLKWKNPIDYKWYMVKIKKHHSLRWDKETESIRNTLLDYPENFETEVTS